MNKIAKTVFLGLVLLALNASADSAIVVVTEPSRPIAPLSEWKSTNDYLGRAKFYKDVSGTVRVHGAIFKWNGPALAQLAFVLPEGYRPEQVEWFPLATAFGYGSLEVLPTGEAFVTASFGPDNYFTWVSLSGVAFRAQ